MIGDATRRVNDRVSGVVPAVALINEHADDLNAEAEDVLTYQGDL